MAELMTSDDRKKVSKLIGYSADKVSIDKILTDLLIAGYNIDIYIGPLNSVNENNRIDGEAKINWQFC